MYLNNAYHFYSPEPGPTTFLWFRMIYKDNEGNEAGAWYKVPDMDEEGNHHHPVTLEYQRMMAMTDNCNATEASPPVLVTNKEGQSVVADYVRRRQEASDPKQKIGVERPKLVVPFHPFVPQVQQFSMPSDLARKVIRSYARHVAYAKADNPDLPGSKLVAVKVYRVVHMIPPVYQFAKAETPMPANDPVLYRPYYVGTFDPEGKLLDAPEYKDGVALKLGDPFLYWMLPILRVDPDKVESTIRDYARKHAGDPNWIRDPHTGQWIDHEP
jgi:hypothetical protein